MQPRPTTTSDTGLFSASAPAKLMPEGLVTIHKMFRNTDAGLTCYALQLRFDTTKNAQNFRLEYADLRAKNSKTLNLVLTALAAEDKAGSNILRCTFSQPKNMNDVLEDKVNASLAELQSNADLTDIEITDCDQNYNKITSSAASTLSA